MALLTCAGCGCAEHVELIDAKPSDGDWESGDYDRFLCIACYGPGWAPLADASLDKSVCGHLEPHYERFREAATRPQELPVSA
ncbi:hypothetical protein [Methylorubrum extorquens]|uniref:hypothetical protein n=1 Tax=Methylorubrum extorquens TaxID=408 RepID=UPI0020A1B5FB|nr:hypothetical protein [Methylorubrum extorquens]MCP1540113.1 hypothetical protein [Methylorubrum extorquens]